MLLMMLLMFVFGGRAIDCLETYVSSLERERLTTQRQKTERNLNMERKQEKMEAHFSLRKKNKKSQEIFCVILWALSRWCFSFSSFLFLRHISYWMSCNFWSTSRTAAWPTPPKMQLILALYACRKNAINLHFGFVCLQKMQFASKIGVNQKIHPPN